jgi:hypothetical protein
MRVAIWLLACASLLGCNQIFGLDETRAAIDAPAGMCCAPDPACAAIADVGACDLQPGCAWRDEPTCVGAATACDGLDPVACSGQAGCDPIATGCGGAHLGCSTYSATGTDCAAHGCVASTCGGTHTACSAYTGVGPDTCQAHACTWQAASCDGAHAPCGSYFDPTACTAHGCAWLGATVDAGALCTGTPHGCAAHTGDSQGCAAAACTSLGPACGGTPHGCCGLGDTCSQHGCTADQSPVCCGTPHSCAEHGGANDACVSAGCVVGGELCGGAASGCGALDQSTCDRQLGCAWSFAGGCAAPTDCGDRGAAACGDGCVWRNDC